MMKKYIVILICIIAILALQSCKASDEIPNVKGDFYIATLTATGYWKVDPLYPGPYLEVLGLVVLNHGKVPGRISNAVFKIYADTTLLAEIDNFNFADFCLENESMDLTIESFIHGIGKIYLPYNQFGGCVQKPWTAKPTKVEVSVFITDDNNFTHELHDTGEFFIIGG